MKASELRIGNYYNQFGNIHQVAAPTISVLSLSSEEQLWCKPIPLTEEWLLKFKDKVDYELSDSGDSVFIRTIGPDINEIDIERVKYVHQLQNLYFALTGDELSIKD